MYLELKSGSVASEKEKIDEEKRKQRFLEYQKHFKCFRMGKTGGGQRA